MSQAISQITQNRRQHIKKFESRVLNRSCADLLFYDKLADYLLQCCSAQAKPNTISLFSLLPLIICNSIIIPGEWWSFLIAIIALLMHQVFDIANKKQAYRLSQFNLTTYYLDHLYDAVSCVLVVEITGRLLLVGNQTRIVCVFLFAMLPFYTHHLAMYANGYLTFYNFSPAVQGLLILELLFVACAILPSIPTILIFDIKVSQIFIGLCAIWLIIFLIDDLRTIANMKKDVHQSNLSAENMPIKNLFVIGVFGYVITETTLIEPHLLTDPLYYTFLLAALTLVYTVLTSQLILSYSFEQKHRQFTLNILLTLLFVVLFYSICGLVDIEDEVEVFIGRVMFGVLVGSQFGYFLYYHYSNVKYLNGIIRDQ